MKRSVSLLICFMILSTALVSSALFADERVQNLESRVVESFDDPDAQQWEVLGSKFIAEGFPQMTYARAWPEALFGRNNEGRDLRVLGAKAAFDRTGYNYLEFIPVAVGEGGDLVPDPIPLPGRVKQIDMWVWGSNYDYYVEAHIRDFTGRVHVLQLGSIKFVGWKNLAAGIPPYVPQAGGYVTEGGFNKPIDLLKIVMWTKPTENVSGFNIYLDHIKVLTDTFVTRFDGDQLADPERINEIWSNGGGE